VCKLVTRGHVLRSLVTLLVAAYPDGHDREEGCTLVAAMYGMFCSLVAGDGEAVDELQAMGLRHVELQVGLVGLACVFCGCCVVGQLKVGLVCSLSAERCQAVQVCGRSWQVSVLPGACGWSLLVCTSGQAGSTLGRQAWLTRQFG
jgi:hypothetical protein